MSASEPERIVRLSFFDDAGLSSEPYVVVGGIMIHADDQYEPLRKYILDMADDLVGKNRPEDFFFTAKELWHGHGFFPREDWPLEKRLRILSHLADIPRLFGLPIIYTCEEKAPHLPTPDLGDARRIQRREKGEAIKTSHAVCFVNCLQTVERWMREHHKDERVFVIVEDHADHRQHLRWAQQILADPRRREFLESDPSIKMKPLTHVVEDPLFSAKSGSSPLQIADVCSFILSHALADGEHAREWLERIEGNLVSGFRRSFLSRPVAE